VTSTPLQDKGGLGKGGPHRTTSTVIRGGGKTGGGSPEVTKKTKGGSLPGPTRGGKYDDTCGHNGALVGIACIGDGKEKNHAWGACKDQLKAYHSRISGGGMDHVGLPVGH